MDYESKLVYHPAKGWVIDLLDFRSIPVHSEFYKKWMNFHTRELSDFYLRDDLSTVEIIQIINSKLEKFDAYFCSDRTSPPIGNQWLVFKTLAGFTGFLLENYN